MSGNKNAVNAAGKSGLLGVPGATATTIGNTRGLSHAVSRTAGTKSFSTTKRLKKNQTPTTKRKKKKSKSSGTMSKTAQKAKMRTTLFSALRVEDLPTSIKEQPHTIDNKKWGICKESPLLPGGMTNYWLPFLYDSEIEKVLGASRQIKDKLCDMNIFHLTGVKIILHHTDAGLFGDNDNYNTINTARETDANNNINTTTLQPTVVGRILTRDHINTRNNIKTRVGRRESGASVIISPVGGSNCPDIGNAESSITEDVDGYGYGPVASGDSRFMAVPRKISSEVAQAEKNQVEKQEQEAEEEGLLGEDESSLRGNIGEPGEDDDLIALSSGEHEKTTATATQPDKNATQPFHIKGWNEDVKQLFLHLYPQNYYTCELCLKIVGGGKSSPEKE